MTVIFQKFIICTKLDIYVFITLYYHWVYTLLVDLAQRYPLPSELSLGIYSAGWPHPKVSSAQCTITGYILCWLTSPSSAQCTITGYILCWLTSPKGILCPVYYHWVYTLLVDLAQRYPLPSVLSLGIYSAGWPCPKVSSAQCTITGYILCWLTPPKGILCPVYYHWVYTLLVDLAQRYPLSSVLSLGIYSAGFYLAQRYPLPSVLSLGIYSAGWPHPKVSSAQCTITWYILCWLTSPKGILCPVYYHWVYTLLVDLAQRYPLPSVLSLGIYSAGWPCPKVSCWLTSPKGILCPVYYHWVYTLLVDLCPVCYHLVYTLLVDLAQRYPLPSVLSLGMYSAGWPRPKVSSAQCTITRYILCWLTSPKGILFQVYYHWVCTLLVDLAQRYPLPSVYSAGWPRPKVSSAQCTITGYILCWLTSPKGILCPVYYHWVYTLLVDLTQRYPLPSVLSLGIYSAGWPHHPLPSVLSLGIYSAGWPRPKVSSAQCTVTGYILCWLTSPKGILCPVCYHLVYTLLVDLAQRYPLLSVLSMGIYSAGWPRPKVSSAQCTITGYILCWLTSPKDILCPVYYHLVYTLLVDLTQRYPLPSVLSLGIYSAGWPRPKVSSAQCTITGYILCWLTSTKGILCPVYYHWVYTLLVDLTQRYPLPSVLSLGIYSAGWPHPKVSSAQCTITWYILCWLTSPKGILCPVYYHWVYTLLVDLTQRYPLPSVLSLGINSAGWPRPKVSSAQCTITGYILCWLTSHKGILCPVYYHWVYILLVDLAQRYPLPSVLSLGIYSAGWPSPKVSSAQCTITGYILCWLTSPKGILYPVYYHWVYTLLVDLAQRYPLPSVLSLGIYSAGWPRPKVSSAQCTITGCILCWLTSPKGILCPVYYHWVYTLLVDLAQRYPLPSVLSPGIYSAGWPRPKVSSAQFTITGYILCWLTLPKGIICPVYYHWVYTLLVDLAQRYPLPSVLSLGIYSPGWPRPKVSSAQCTITGYILCWLTSPKGILCPVYYHWVYTLLVDLA